ncbi:MAG: thermonuclease family protein [Alphaproteobacteria bacterium]|nr:thermonuclease family protein [Alphaproteobacteria bacterium]
MQWGGDLARGAHWILVAAAVLAGSAARAQPAAVPPGDCRLSDAGTATVAKVLDARTVTLSDGRELRLAGIEAPQRDEPHAEGARSALERLAAGRELVLRRLGTETDRHGRVLAHVFAGSEPGGRSLQQHLLASGDARVAARVGDLACARGLLAAESSARGSGLGLWKLPYYAVRQAENPGEIAAERGRFAVVEGKVLSVREAGSTVYVNFGRRWSEDFTVTVLKRHERGFAAEGLELRRLAGRHVRVRGTVEERGGPWIEAVRPEQFEIAGRD